MLNFNFLHADKRSAVMRSAVCCALLLAPFSALAHHSPAAFDQNAFVEFEGTVTVFSWGNPHVYFSVATTSSSGESYVQQVEAGPPGQLLPQGLNRDSLQAGARVAVRANPNRRGAGHVVLGVELTLADGSTFPLHARALRALGPGESAATSIAGTWIPQPGRYLGLAREMAGWPLTSLGREARAADPAARQAAQAACIPPGPPALMASSVAIVVTVDDQAVTFDIDSAQQRRVVHLGAQHPAELEPSLFGHSVGHWEGTALIVDTLGFSPHAEGMGFNFPSSAAKHVVERFSLSADGKHLDYEITVEDLVYLSAAVTYRTQWDYRPEQIPSNEACDPAIAKRFLDQE